MIILETTVSNEYKRHVRGYDENQSYSCIDEVIMDNELEDRLLEIFKEHGAIFTNDIKVIEILKKHYEMYEV